MVPLVLFGFALLATATAQPGNCELNDLFANGALEREMAQRLLIGEDNPTQPNITVLRNHTVCRSVGYKRGTFSSISLVIEYSCTGSASCPNGDPAIELYDFGCTSGDQWTHVQFHDYEHGRVTNPTANFDTPLRTDCSACFPVHPTANNPPTIEPVTHCHECRGCSSFGQTACYETDQNQICCNVYVDDMCAVDCPHTSDVLDNNFACGSILSKGCSSNRALIGVTVILIIMAVLLTTALVIALIAVYRLYTSNRKFSNTTFQNRMFSDSKTSNGQPNAKATFYQSNEAYERVKRSEQQETISYDEIHDEQKDRAATIGCYSEVKEAGVTAGDDDSDYVI